MVTSQAVVVENAAQGRRDERGAERVEGRP